MARTHLETVQADTSVTEIQAKNTQELIDAGNQMAIASMAVMDAEEALKMVGRIEAAIFMETVVGKMIAETALALKESKRYKGLPYKDAQGSWKQVSNFEEFCEHKLGRCRRRVDQLISNYNQLGPELYEQAERIGFRQRDYNALKSLPADDRLLIAQAIEEESLEKALDIMQQLAAKHQREKEELTLTATELKKETTAKDAVIAKKDEKLNELDNELERLKLDRPVFAHIDWPESFKGYMAQLAITRKNIKHGMGSLEVIRREAMAIEPESDAESAALDTAREILATELVGIHNECLEMIQALGMQFDRTLGAFSEARINLLNA